MCVHIILNVSLVLDMAKVYRSIKKFHYRTPFSPYLASLPLLQQLLMDIMDTLPQHLTPMVLHTLVIHTLQVILMLPLPLQPLHHLVPTPRLLSLLAYLD